MHRLRDRQRHPIVRELLQCPAANDECNRRNMICMGSSERHHGSSQMSRGKLSLRTVSIPLQTGHNAISAPIEERIHQLWLRHARDFNSHISGRGSVAPNGKATPYQYGSCVYKIFARNQRNVIEWSLTRQQSLHRLRCESMFRVPVARETHAGEDDVALV